MQHSEYTEKTTMIEETVFEIRRLEVKTRGRHSAVISRKSNEKFEAHQCYSSKIYRRI